MVKISDDELLSELEKCHDEQGKVTATILNDPSNDYPTQPTYSSRFGSLGKALDKCGLEKQKPGRNSKWTKSKIISTVENWYNPEKNLNTSIFNSEDELPSTHIIYKNFDSLDKLYKECGIYKSVKENRKSLRKSIHKVSYNEENAEDLIHHLLWIQSQEGNTKSSTIDSTNGPSSHTYRNVFGSLKEARREAGLKETYRENYTDRIGELPSEYEENADGYTYVLQMRRGAESYYYVGMSTSIRSRLNGHSSGKTYVTLHHQNERDTLDNLNLVPTSILRVENMYKKDEEDDEAFRNRMKSKEHVISYEISAGLNTSNILGGVS